jgi:hypothetical protein
LYCDGGNFEGVFAATIYFDMSEASQLRAMNVITRSYTFGMYFCYTFVSMIDIFLQVDLIMTL